MKAVVSTRYGPPDVVQIQDVEKPVPKDNEILIDIRAASVNPLDWHFMRGDVRLLTGVLAPKHKVLGAEMAGRVEAVGKDVKQFQPGDEVFGGLSGKGMGGFAEYACSVEERLALEPAAISFEEAAAVTWRRSLPFRVFAIRDGSSQVKRFWSMAPLAVWVRSRSRLPSRLALKSLLCAARGS
jgi:NADPH:quinone reductase-like Zn-dependent oxidoreductase